jgi:two-component system, NarL family, invasion response regulator UvrY
MMEILLADDQSRVRFALRILLEQQQGWKVTGEAADARELFCKAQLKKPDLVILDGDLPGLDTTDCIAKIRKLYPEICLIAMSEQPEKQDLSQLEIYDAYSSKSNPPEYLLAVIHRSLDGGKTNG